MKIFCYIIKNYIDFEDVTTFTCSKDCPNYDKCYNKLESNGNTKS